MKDLLEFIVKALVDDPAAVDIEIVPKGDIQIYKLKTAKEDVGKVIGKRGKNARALRTILKSISAKEGRKTVLEIVD